MTNSDFDCDSFRHASSLSDSAGFVFLLRRRLPLRVGAGIVARARRSAGARLPSRCSVIQIYDVGDDRGLLCHLEFADARADSAILVAPITEPSFDSGSPVFREIAAYQKSRRAQNVEATGPRASARR